MNVGELIQKLQELDPELKVVTGVTCSCYGTQEADDVEVVEDPSHYKSGIDVAYIS